MYKGKSVKWRFFYLESFAEFGRGATFGFTEESVEMAEGIEAAGETYFCYRQFGGK